MWPLPPLALSVIASRLNAMPETNIVPFAPARTTASAPACSPWIGEARPWAEASWG